MRRKDRLLSCTAIDFVTQSARYKNALKPIIKKFLLFTTADKRWAVITRDTIDRGLVAAAGINLIDGDKIEDGDTLPVAALALAQPAGNA